MATDGESLPSTMIQDGALAALEAGAIVAATTLLSHRQETHQSVILKEPLRTASRVALWMTGVKPRLWADVHRTHHAYPDANLGPILETADFLEWADDNPGRVPSSAIPEVFPVGTLDPAAELSAEEVRVIGGAVRKTVTDKYVPPEDYSSEDTARLLGVREPRYFYEDKVGLIGQWRRRKLPPEEPPEGSVQRVFPELRDPHSPPLHRSGIWGIYHENVYRYKQLVRYHEANHDPESTVSGHADKWDRRLFDRSALGLTAMLAGNVGYQVLKNTDRSRRGLLGSAARGGVIAFGAIEASVIGGKITNAGGHAGRSIMRGLLTGKPEVKDDGTYTSNVPALSWPTFDEVGGQEVHHYSPWQRAYTYRTGWRGVVQAPFGSVVNALAKRGMLMEPGEQFGHSEIEERPALRLEDLGTDRYIRPDEASEAVLMLMALRARTVQKRRAA